MDKNVLSRSRYETSSTCLNGVLGNGVTEFVCFLTNHGALAHRSQTAAMHRSVKFEER